MEDQDVKTRELCLRIMEETDELLESFKNGYVPKMDVPLPPLTPDEISRLRKMEDEKVRDLIAMERGEIEDREIS